MRRSGIRDPRDHQVHKRPSPQARRKDMRATHYHTVASLPCAKLCHFHYTTSTLTSFGIKKERRLELLAVPTPLL